MWAFVDGADSKNRVETPPQWKKITFFEIIGEFFINYEMTTPIET